MSPRIMLTDPLFYALAVPAVTLIGLSKGGFGGGMALLGVPLLALIMPPQQAAGLILPILIFMDTISLYAYRRHFDRAALSVLLPAGLLGTLIGWALASQVSDDGVRLLVGAVAVVFSLDFALRGRKADGSWTPPRWLGLLCGTVGSFTSFVAHAGSPPLQVYLLPQKLPKEVYAGTSVIYFTFINLAKIIPYATLGQLGATNLMASAAMLPVALVATLLGVWLVRRVPVRPFYIIAYTSVFLVGFKLLWDGLAGIGWL